MMSEKLRKIWEEGKVSTNAWLSIPNSWTAEIFAHLGFDSLTIDMQHGLSDFETAVSMLRSISTGTSLPLVRVPWNDPILMMRILDAGAFGIICPMINNKEEAKSFIQSCLYPPKGIRSYGPLRVELYEKSNYQKRANDQIITLAMIETSEGYQNLEHILTLDDLDGIYIGTMDLSLSLGIDDLGNLEHPDLRDAIENILEIVRKSGKVAGIHSQSPDDTKLLKQMGFQIITPLNDSKLLQKTARRILKNTKKFLQE